MTVVYDKQANLADPREINLCFYTNPTSLAIVGYRTTLDPAVVSEKLNPGVPPAQIQIAEIDGNILGAWAEDYGTGTDDAKVWHKVDVPANAPAPIIVYDRTPLGEEEDSEDDEHKRFVTDITGEKGHVMHLLFAGASTPDGYTDETAAGGYFADKFPVGAQAGLTANSDTNGPTASLVSCSNALGCSWCEASWPGTDAANHSHGIGSIAAGTANNVPEYKALKIIRSNKIRAYIPKDAIIIFGAAVPAGFTRYSDQDGKYVRGGNTVGGAGGASTRRFLVSGTTAVYTARHLVPSEPNGGGYPCPTHSHSFSAYSAYINNDPPYITVVLGKADNAINYIPAGAIMMFDETPPSDDWEVLSWGGKLLKGGASYGSTGGNATNTPANLTANTKTYRNPMPESNSASSGCVDGSDNHYHSMVFSFSAVSTYPACRPVIFAKAKHDITEDGPEACVIASDVTSSLFDQVMWAIESTCGRHIAIRNKGTDLGELHCVFTSGSTDYVYHSKSTNGGKTWSEKAKVDSSFGPQHFSDMVVDKDNNIHVVWVEGGGSGNKSVKYRRLSAADTWGSVEQVSTAGADYQQMWPCIQVKNDGVTIGVVWTGKGWGSDTDKRNVAYRERSTSSWGSEEAITSDATTNYNYSSLDYDTDDYPHIVCDNDALNIYYWYKTAAGWQTREQVNSDDNNNADFPSNVLIDIDNNICVAYREATNHHIRFKKKSRGGAWPTKETVATASTPYSYTAPQLQVNGDGSIYCCYTKQTYVGTSLAERSAAYKVKTTSWSSETVIAESDAISYVYCQLMWSRLPLKDGIFQQKPQQGMVAISLTHPVNDQSVGSLVFLTPYDTVVGEIESPPTKKSYNLKRRGAICLSKINGPLASPALIS